MIFLQLVFLTYLFLTPLYYLSQTHSLLPLLLNSLILLSTYTLTVASLLQTFRADPGYLSMHHIEQIKLGLSYIQSEASAQMMEFGGGEQEEQEEERRVKDETVKDMNRALIATIKKIQ